MQHVEPIEPKTNNRKTEDGARHCGGRRGWKALALPGFVAASLLAGSFGQRHLAFSQQSSIPAVDVQARSRDIMAHLNSVIQFYRSSIQPIQKAGEPNDVIYRDQAVAQASQVAGFAFQSAKAESALIAGYQAHTEAQASGAQSGEQQRMQNTEAMAEKQIAALKAQEAALDKQIASAKPKALAGLQAQRKQIEGALDLETAMKDALEKIVGMVAGDNDTGLVGDIERLQQSVPELQGTNKTAAPPLTTLESARSSGLTSQGAVLFELIETRHALTTLIHNNDRLHQQALALRLPMSKILRSLVQQGQQLSQDTAAAVTQAAAAQAAATGKAAVGHEVPAATQTNSGATIGNITTEFKALAAATVPLSQEIIVLEQSRANLAAWQAAVDQEYNTIFHALLLRILVIAIALGVIIGAGELWTRATNKYVRDIRRRRQFLIVRRVVVSFLSVLVILFGFVTQFNSLATFAGFITAGIAVGLQTILLSVAAYFFIIGRYGIKVGDRITISSVTGDVIDVGLVRFYMMELAGSGTALNPTGRVAVFSNAVLFQAGTPLYKQIPGTEYAWHELTVKLTDAANYRLVCDAMMKEVHAIYESYRTQIERQHRDVQNWMQTAIDPPGIESRLQFSGGAFQLWARFPVQITNASEVDEKVTQALFDLMARNAEVKAAVAATPMIQASVRG